MQRPTLVVPVCLVVGALLGLAGSLVPSASTRGVLWGIDGTALVIAGALLAVHYFRQGDDFVAAGFVVFTVGEGLVVSTSAMSLEASVPIFAAGASLWAASLAMISAPRVMPAWVRVTGIVASVLSAVTALMVFAGNPLSPLSKPLPFLAYPFLVLTLLGWAWTCLRR